MRQKSLAERFERLLDALAQIVAGTCSFLTSLFAPAFQRAISRRRAGFAEPRGVNE
jgi:hypothetical protein